MMTWLSEKFGHRAALQTALGGAAWVVWTIMVSERRVLDEAVAFAALIVVPMGLRLAATPTRAGVHALPWRVIVLLQPLAAIALLISLATSPGRVAGWCSLPWLMVGLCAALFGLWRFLPRPQQRLDEVCLDAALWCLPVGGAWLVAERFGWAPFGFGGTIARLTAIHFHFAGFALLVFAAMTGRSLSRTTSAFRVCAACLLSGIPLVALGIVQSRHGISIVSLAATLVLSTGVWLLAFQTITRVAGIHPRWVGALLGLASVAATVAMALASLYSLGGKFGLPLIDMAGMWKTHGLLQAVGFCFAGLLAWLCAHPASRLPAPGIPFSQLTSGGFTGPDFFTRTGALDETRSHPTGIVDALDDYRRPDFETRDVAQAVRAFYENTSAHGLLVCPEWQSGFAWLGRMMSGIGARLGQMRFPLTADTKADLIQSQIVAVRDLVDGRTNVRGWIRTYESGHAMYVAAYSTHRLHTETFMNIAFPLPGGNVTSILRLRALGAGVELTTLHDARLGGDQGVFFANGFCPVRLPIDETISVWPASAAPPELARGFPRDMTVLARHDMWFLGIKFLVLKYGIWPV